MPAIPQPPDRFGDELIELRAIAGWDIPEVLIAFQDDRDLYRRLGMAKPPTGASLGTEVERAGEQRRAGREIALTIVEPGQNDCRGRVLFDDFDWDAARASMRLWVAPQVRGRGYEQHALTLATGWLFASVAVDTVEAAVDGEPPQTLTRPG